jgi:hypothetical protein
MSEPGLSISVVWFDVDLLELEVLVEFDAWSGAERGYVTREELIAFADALDRVAAGVNEATLEAGQAALGYAKCRVFEYTGVRRLGMEVVLEREGGRSPELADLSNCARNLRVSIPIERAPLPAFARALRAITASERGTAFLPALPTWP